MNDQLADCKRMIDADIEPGSIPMENIMTMSGIEVFEAMLAGELPPPPIAKTFNFTLTNAKKGMAEFTGIPLRDYYNPLGTIHGGWAATILDSALGCCVHTMLEPGMGYTTVEFKTNYIRPIFEDTGKVICTGNVIHMGRTIATSEARLVSEAGKLLAHATETCAIFPMKRD